MESLHSDSLNNEGGDNGDRLVKYSFYITYAFLVTTATITFIEAMRNKDSKIRHILNLETCISVVAAFFYGMFMKKINTTEINYKEININRYVDWGITTPIMLLVLLLAFGYNSKKKITVSNFAIVLLLNYAMLIMGFVGETNNLNKPLANTLGFVFFIGMYYFIYHHYIRKFKNFDNKMLYWAFVFFWALYGVAYTFSYKNQNISYNILDIFSKNLNGLLIFGYIYYLAK